MKSFIKPINEEMPANNMGGGFADAQAGDPGKLAGLPGIMGCPGPAVPRAGECWRRRKAANKKEEERISKLIRILMKNVSHRRFIEEKVTEKGKTYVGDKGIAGLVAGDIANNMPPPKNVPATKLPTTQVNGFTIDVPTVFTELVAAQKRFSKFKINPERINDASYIYKTRNNIGQADTMNDLNGIEMRLFFRRPEDDESPATINRTVQQTHKNQINNSLINHFRKKTNV